MSDVRTDAVVKAVRAMEGFGPEPLLEDARHHLRRSAVTLDEDELVDLITSTDVNHSARKVFHLQLNRWDAADGDEWTGGTAERSAERRALVLELLGFGPASRERVDTAFPRDIGAVVISKAQEWGPWYTHRTAADRSFYWAGYRSVLERKMDGDSVQELDRVTHEIVRRLADPTRRESYQTKGLVVGHVQSGKTANFTGVIAKAVDAGYRLVIVLTGTIELLRAQTQRRLDMELVGEENILGGQDKNDPEQVSGIDYAGAGDRDWLAGRFIRYGKHPKDQGRPGIRRLTHASGDYRRLKAGLGFLDFRDSDHFADSAKPLFDEVNLHGTDIRLAVVKKNKSVLEKLVKDLRAIRSDLGEIPTLIIDDEADQASINTTDPRKRKQEQTDRTAINRLIAELLHELSRSQYIGYTATPFANVFVDPDDVDDIFPKDFIVSLTPPAEYMGGQQFHDLDRDPDVDDPDAGTMTNERAFTRSLSADSRADDDPHRLDEIRRALDAYVLSGALKLFRKEHGVAGDFRHHTMLVHESVSTTEHNALAQTIKEVWTGAAYTSPQAVNRLHELWQSDFVPVSAERAPHLPQPDAFGQLRTFVGAAVDRIRSGYSPVIVVNGAAERDYVQEDLDFQGGDVWKILVGGTKLSRGFTVEGLTTTYYTRRTNAADSLMQMGRWFGYRKGYGDLVRIFMGRNVPGPRHTSSDLYKAFEAVVRDEEDFRDQLRQYAGAGEDGRPRVRPIDVPPLVFQTLPWLAPTGRNKMFNARLTRKGVGGKAQDFFQQPPRDPAVNQKHFEAGRILLDAATSRGRFFDITDTGSRRRARHPGLTVWHGRYGIVDAATMLGLLRTFEWAKNFSFDPTLDFLRDATQNGLLRDWAVIVPDLASTSVQVASRTVGERSVDVLKRQRRPQRGDTFAGSSPRQRLALEIVSGGASAPTHPRRAAVSEALLGDDFRHIGDSLLDPDGRRGAMLLTFSKDDGIDSTGPRDLPDDVAPADIATLFSLAMPYRSAPQGRIAFAVRFKDGRPTYLQSQEG